MNAISPIDFKRAAAHDGAVFGTVFLDKFLQTFRMGHMTGFHLYR